MYGIGVFWLVVIAVIAWIVVRASGNVGGASGRGGNAEGILRERYARGEIDEAAYRRMLDELRKS